MSCHRGNRSAQVVGPDPAAVLVGRSATHWRLDRLSSDGFGEHRTTYHADEATARRLARAWCAGAGVPA